MRALYVEIHDSSFVALEEKQKEHMQNLIRRTRNRNFFNSRPERYQPFYDDFVENGFRDEKTVPGRQHVLDCAMIHFRVDNTDFGVLDGFLAQLVKACGYSTLAICLHSSTFLDYVRTGVDRYDLDVDVSSCTNDENERPKLGWQPRLDATRAAEDSLELFAKLRGLDFQPFIWHCEEEFRVLLSTVFRSFNKPLDHEDYGFIGTPVVKEIHPVKSWNIAGKHWALQLTENTPAEVCTITYTVTQQLANEFPELIVGQLMTEVQEDIPDSIVLVAYHWPGQASWPSDDPREDGYTTPCWLCEAVRGPVQKKRPKVAKRPCSCTLADKQLIMKMPTDPRGAVRVPYELITTEKLGRGVRALQNFEIADILGIYHGEIYPRSKMTSTQAERRTYHPGRDTPNRYGDHGLGSSYIFDCDMPQGRHAKPSKNRKKKKKKGNGDDDDDDDFDKPHSFNPLDAEEWKRYRVDSAVKGNWTRFINHSCDNILEFDYRNAVLGGKRYAAVVATRDINFGEYLTIHCGYDYFCSQKFACKCGSECCILWNAENPRLELRTLKDAIAEGNAPEWARDLELPKASKASWSEAKNELKRRKAEIKRRQEALERGDPVTSTDDGNSDSDEDGDEDSDGNGAAAATKTATTHRTQNNGKVPRASDRGASSGGKRAKQGTKSASTTAARGPNDVATPTRRSARATTQQQSNAATVSAAARRKKTAAASGKSRASTGNAARASRKGKGKSQPPVREDAVEEEEEDYETAPEEPSPHGRGKRKRVRSARAAEAEADEPANKRRKRK